MKKQNKLFPFAELYKKAHEMKGVLSYEALTASALCRIAEHIDNTSGPKQDDNLFDLYAELADEYESLNKKYKSLYGEKGSWVKKLKEKEKRVEQLTSYLDEAIKENKKLNKESRDNYKKYEEESKKVRELQSRMRAKDKMFDQLNHEHNLLKKTLHKIKDADEAIKENKTLEAERKKQYDRAQELQSALEEKEKAFDGLKNDYNELYNSYQIIKKLLESFEDGEAAYDLEKEREGVNARARMLSDEIKAIKDQANKKVLYAESLVRSREKQADARVRDARQERDAFKEASEQDAAARREAQSKYMDLIEELENIISNLDPETKRAFDGIL
jgi:chromosome segregation ATPase